MEKAKKISVIVVFALLIFGLAIAHVLLPDKENSDTERHTLTQLSDLSGKDLKGGAFQSTFETYLEDQFPLRDTFRGIKTVLDLHVWQMKDSNGYYNADGHLMELSKDTETSKVQNAVNIINSVLKNHPEIANAWYSIIPDKNYFLAESNGYPALDYKALAALMEGVNAQKIDLTGVLSLDDYYKTDLHWNQDRIFPVVNALCEAMGVKAPSPDSFTAQTIPGFQGVYGDHMAYPFLKDDLVYLENDATKDAVVHVLNDKTLEWDQIPMYDPAAFTHPDPYDVFLAGPTTLITIENPHADNDRQLIIFRDSFTSSLAPLLTGSYSKITLVDLRYISSRFVDRLVDFEDADVLFLYSTTLLNAGDTLKK